MAFDDWYNQSNKVNGLGFQEFGDFDKHDLELAFKAGQESQKPIHPLVRKLVRLQQKYIKMLSDEIDSFAPLAHTHGWKSKNIEIGEKLREQTKKVKKELT